MHYFVYKVKNSKGCEKMNLIKCVRNCKYQSDGYCCRDECGEVKCIVGGCPYYEKNSPPQNGDEQSDK